MPERRGAVQDGPRPDRAALAEQVSEQVTGQPALHVEQVPLLEQQQRDDQGKPFDDAELDGFGLGRRAGYP